jgi:ABC-type amino acid transport system permease subunit
MIFFIFLKTLVIGAIIGALLYAFASKESSKAQVAVSKGLNDPQSNPDPNFQPLASTFLVLMRFIRNLAFLILIFFIPFVLFRFIV